MSGFEVLFTILGSDVLSKRLSSNSGRSDGPTGVQGPTRGFRVQDQLSPRYERGRIGSVSGSKYLGPTSW